jgi:hypothetical protein
MIRSKPGTLIQFIVFACALDFGVLSSCLWGQAPVVFMTSSSNLHRFDNGIETFSVSGPSSGGFLGVTTLNNSVLVADSIANKIQKFSPAGAYQGAFAAIIDPTFLESDSSGNIYTNPSSLGGPVATRFNSAGVATQTFTHPTMHQDAGMDADAAGNVYIVDQFQATRTLFKFAPNGTFLNSTPIDPTIVPEDLAIDETGQRLYLVSQASASPGIRVFDISGLIPVPAGTIAVPAGVSPEGIQFAAESGHILITDFGVPSSMPRGFELSQTGTVLRTYTPSPSDLGWDITTFGVPEPHATALIAVAMMGAIGWRRRDA